MEIIILQIVMPFLLDGQFKIFISAVLRKWCVSVAWLLGLRSYLLGDVLFRPGVSYHLLFYIVITGSTIVFILFPANICIGIILL